MRDRFVLLSLFLLPLLLVGCGPTPRQRVAAMLDKVESYIDARPDSALAVLRTLDLNSLAGPGQRARAALLHQMALDKCYIDITSDSILSPAFWYLKHGTAGQKLKTWYYRSVLARNAGDVDAQMSCLVRGEQYVPRAKDPLMAGRLYTSKRVLFLHLCDLENAASDAEKAVVFFRQAGSQDRYLNAVLGLANLYNLQRRYVESGVLIDTLRMHWTELSASQKNKVLAVGLSQKIGSGLSDQDLSQFVPSYLAEVSPLQIDWTLVAQAYLLMGEKEKARSALARVRPDSLDTYAKMTFLMVRSDLYSAFGQDKEALEQYRQFRMLMDERTERSLSSRAKFLAEEEKLLADRTNKSRWIWILAAVAFIMCLSVLFIRQRLRERQQVAVHLQGQLDKTNRQVASLKQQVRAAEREAGRWKDLMQKERLPSEMQQLISERVEALQRYSFALVSRKDGAKALSVLEASVSRDRPEQFLQDLTLQYGFLHPGLTRLFQEYSLTDQEKTCCTLLSMGCKTKEIASLTHLSEQRCYNIFNTVRRKMGLKTESRTLFTLLQERMKE